MLVFPCSTNNSHDKAAGCIPNLTLLYKAEKIRNHSLLQMRLGSASLSTLLESCYHRNQKPHLWVSVGNFSSLLGSWNAWQESANLHGCFGDLQLVELTQPKPMLNASSLEDLVIEIAPFYDIHEWHEFPQLSQFEKTSWVYLYEIRSKNSQEK